MKSTPYYVPVSPKYLLSEREGKSLVPPGIPGDGEKPQPVAGQDSDLFANFLDARLKTIQICIRQVTDEIESRERLRDKALSQVQDQLKITKEQLLQVAPHGSSPFTLGDSRRRSALEREVSALELEKQREESGAWRDIATLKKELRVLIREYLEEKRRQEVARG